MMTLRKNRRWISMHRRMTSTLWLKLTWTNQRQRKAKKTCDITKTPDSEQSLKLPPVEDLPTMQVSSSELTKSLRQVRLNKKTPVKSPLKEKWQPRNLTPDLDKEKRRLTMRKKR